MRMEFREVGPEFDSSTVNTCLPFVQSTPYFLWNTKCGRKGYRCVGSRSGQDVFFVQFFAYVIHSVKVLYAPLGHVTSSPALLNEKEADDFTDFLSDMTHKAGCSFIRIHSADTIPRFRKTPHYASRGSFMQPQHDRVIALDGEYVLPNSIKKIIKKAEETISLEAAGTNKDAVEDFLQLMKETGKQKSLRLHSDDYYRTLFTISDGYEEPAELLFAVRGGKRIAVMVLAKAGKNATYLFGGMSEEGKEHSASYFLQHSAIQRAEQLGMQQYSLGGVSGGQNAERDPLHGVSIFKRKFGGVVKNYGDPHDLVMNSIHYGLYSGYKAITHMLRR